MVSATFKSWPGENRATIQRAGWVSWVMVDNSNGEAAAMDRETVFCLLVCSVELGRWRSGNEVYCLVLRKGDQPGQFKRIGIRRSEFVYLIEDCERSPRLEYINLTSDELMKAGQISKSSIMEEWFKNAEEQEITLI
jgi:hypothetical protein